MPKMIINCETQEITYEEITDLERVQAKEQVAAQPGNMIAQVSRREDAKQTMLDLATKSSVGPFRNLAQAVCDYLGIEPDEEDTV